MGIGWEHPPPKRIGGPPPAATERAERSQRSGSGHPAWRDDDRAVLVGLIASVVLFVVYLGYWTNWFALAGGPPTPARVAGRNGPGNADTHPAWGWVATGVIIGVPIIAMLWFAWRERRSARKQFESLPTPEQERRRQAAALLREIEPPVDEVTAREQLRAPVAGAPPFQGPHNN